MPQMNKGGKFIFGQSIIQGQKTRRLRAGVYLFAIMEWVSAIGYRMFPLSDSGYAGAFQDVMHMVVTALVVLLSIVAVSLIFLALVRWIPSPLAIGSLPPDFRLCRMSSFGGALLRKCKLWKLCLL